MRWITLQEATEAVELLLLNQGASTATINAYESDIKQFWSDKQFWSGGSGRPFSICTEQLDAFAVAWLNDHRTAVSPATSARRRAAMRKLGEAFGVSVAAVWRAPRVQRGKAHPLPQLLDDARAMLSKCQTDDHRALMILMAFCGLRISEARNVWSGDFMMEADGGATLAVRGKGNTIRMVPVLDFAWIILLECIKRKRASRQVPEGCEVRLVELSDRGARYAVTALGIRAGVTRPVASHDMRMTFGTVVQAATGNLRVTQELLGHASVTTTQVYTGVTSDEMRDAVRGAMS